MTYKDNISYGIAAHYIVLMIYGNVGITMYRPPFWTEIAIGRYWMRFNVNLLKRFYYFILTVKDLGLFAIFATTDIVLP